MVVTDSKSTLLPFCQFVGVLFWLLSFFSLGFFFALLRLLHLRISCTSLPYFRHLGLIFILVSSGRCMCFRHLVDHPISQFTVGDQSCPVTRKVKANGPETASLPYRGNVKHNNRFNTPLGLLSDPLDCHLRQRWNQLRVLD